MKKLLLTLLTAVMSITAWGEKVTDYTNIVSGKKYYIGATTSSTDYYLKVDGNGQTEETGKSGTAVTSTSDANIFVFEGSGTSWTIKFDDTSNYLSLASSKANGKVNVVSEASTFTLSNQNGKIRLAIGNYSVEKNNSGTQFGSYGHTQTDVWLLPVDDSSNTDPDPEDPEDPEPDPTPTKSTTYYQVNVEDILPTQTALVVWTNANGSYAASNNNGTSSAPTAVAVTVSNGKITTDAANIGWNIDYNDEDGTFQIIKADDNEKWLYCTNTNNGVRVGTGAAKAFQIKDDYLYEDGTTDPRYLGVYNSLDIRCYTSINANIKEQTLSFYVAKETVTIGAAGWATYVTPCALDFSESAVDAYAAKVNGNEVALNPLTTVPAGEAIIVKGTTGNVPVAASAAGIDNDLTYSNDPVTTDGTQFILAKKGNDVVFAKATGTIPASKGYLVVPSVSAASLRVVIEGMEDGNQTGISLTPSLTEGEGACYDLFGRKTNGKGLMIQNGKVVLVK